LGALRVTLLITGGVFVAAGAGTEDAVAAGTTSCPVDTAAGNEVAAPGTPSSRRAAASITHDTGDCAGATGPVPSNGAHTDSTSPDAAAGFGGAASITGWTATTGATINGTDTGVGTQAAAGLPRSLLSISAPTEAGTSTVGCGTASRSVRVPLGNSTRSLETGGCGVEADGEGTPTRAS
jgi:hypothetical protein